MILDFVLDFDSDSGSDSGSGEGRADIIYRSTKVYILKYGYICGYIQMYIDKKKLYENCGQLDKLWTRKLPKITFFLISH